MKKEGSLTFNSFFIISLTMHIIFILLTYRQIQNKPQELILEVSLINLIGKRQPPALNIEKEVVPEVKQEVPPEQEIIPTEEKISVTQNSESPQGATQIVSESGEGGSTPQIESQLLRKYLLLVQEKIDSQKSYPKKALEKGEEGIIHVKFTILANGNVFDARVILSSGFPDLDKSAILMVKSASPFPAPPQNFRLTMKLPITFKISHLCGNMD